MSNHTHNGEDCSEFVEVDPTGRYGRYKEILGKGASKTVYRAYDEYQGIEVAWNQVKLYDFLNNPQDLERLYCEIHLLKTLKHNNIMKYYTSWVDTEKRHINFVTEMFSSGTLKQYREKHKRANIRAIKSWCRQILKGLHYLHTLDPPVIHRDLKCDNIFVNGNQGEVKIGDLGLAAVLRKSHVAHCVGTPEFMAPEVYAEEYNELVDIYSFGMCILEMITFEYPYSECTHSAQIYKKVISGEKPEALYKVKDPEVRKFVDKCLANVSLRLSAKELLDDSFLKDDSEFDLESMGSWRERDSSLSLPREPFVELDNVAYLNGIGSLVGYSNVSERKCDSTDFGIKLFERNNDEVEEHSTEVGITMKGKRRDDGSIFLRLRMSDGEERVRNIYFPFDIENDTALSVATEMVAELDLTDQDVTIIADMIDSEIKSLVPEWNPGPGFMETPRRSKSSCCENCASKYSSTGSFFNFLPINSFSKEIKFLQCLGDGCAATHGRFEEVTYQIESPLKTTAKSVAKAKISDQDGKSNGLCLREIWNIQKSLECSTEGSGESEEIEKVDKIISTKSMIKEKGMDKNTSSFRRCLNKTFSVLSINRVSCFSHDLPEEYENEIEQEMRWVRAKYQMEMRDLNNQQQMKKKLINGISPLTISNPFQGEIIVKSFSNRKKRETRKARKSKPVHGSFAYKLC